MRLPLSWKVLSRVFENRNLDSEKPKDRLQYIKVHLHMK